jgi:hypothetical protein
VRTPLKATSLFAISAFLVLLVLSAIDLPETNFDEANTPTNDMVVQEQSRLFWMHLVVDGVGAEIICAHAPSHRMRKLETSSAKNMSAKRGDQ